MKQAPDVANVLQGVLNLRAKVETITTGKETRPADARQVVHVVQEAKAGRK